MTLNSVPDPELDPEFQAHADGVVELFLRECTELCARILESEKAWDALRPEDDEESQKKRWRELVHEVRTYIRDRAFAANYPLGETALLRRIRHEVRRRGGLWVNQHFPPGAACDTQPADRSAEKLQMEDVTPEVAARLVDDFCKEHPNSWARWALLERANEPIDDVHGHIAVFVKERVATRNLSDLSRLIMLLRTVVMQRARQTSAL